MVTVNSAKLRIEAASDDKPVVIVGGGIAGLTAAYKLHKQGIPTLLVEKTPRFGGRMESEHRHQAVFESGQQFYYSAYKEVRGLLAEVGLQDELIDAPVIGSMCWEGKTATFDKHVPWLSLGTVKENFQLQKAIGRKSMSLLGNDIFELAQTDPNERITVDEYFSGRLSEKTYELAVRPMVTSYSFAEGDGHSLAMLLKIIKLGAFASTLALKKGNDALPRALAQHVRTLHGDVTNINLANGKAASVTVQHNGTTQTIEASHVVCACPPPSAHALFKDSAPQLAQSLSSIDYTATIMVNLALDRKLAGREWVYTHSRRDGHKAAFAIDCLKRCPPAFPDDKSIVMVSFVNPIATEIMAWSDADLVAQSIKDMEVFVPGIASLVQDTSVIRRRVAVPSFQKGMVGQIHTVKRQSETVSGLTLVGDYLRAPLIEGAVRSTMPLWDVLRA